MVDAKKIFQKSVGYIIVIGTIVLITAFLVVHDEKNNRNTKTEGKYADEIKKGTLYTVERVLDGDTLIARVGMHDVTLRLIGIDTPEVVDPRKPVQCYGEEASEKAKEILTHKQIYIEKEAVKGDYDIYGRVLAYIHLPDGQFYNQFMIEQGYAREYTFNKEKYKYQKEFKQAQKDAKKNKRGLWSVCLSSLQK